MIKHDIKTGRVSSVYSDGKLRTHSSENIRRSDFLKFPIRLKLYICRLLKLIKQRINKTKNNIYSHFNQKIFVQLVI